MIGGSAISVLCVESKFYLQVGYGELLVTDLRPIAG